MKNKLSKKDQNLLIQYLVFKILLNEIFQENRIYFFLEEEDYVIDRINRRGLLKKFHNSRLSKGLISKKDILDNYSQISKNRISLIEEINKLDTVVINGSEYISIGKDFLKNNYISRIISSACTDFYNNYVVNYNEKVLDISRDIANLGIREIINKSKNKEVTLDIFNSLITSDIEKNKRDTGNSVKIHEVMTFYMQSNYILRSFLENTKNIFGIDFIFPSSMTSYEIIKNLSEDFTKKTIIDLTEIKILSIIPSVIVNPEIFQFTYFGNNTKEKILINMAIDILNLHLLDYNYPDLRVDNFISDYKYNLLSDKNFDKYFHRELDNQFDKVISIYFYESHGKEPEEQEDKVFEKIAKNSLLVNVVGMFGLKDSKFLISTYISNNVFNSVGITLLFPDDESYYNDKNQFIDYSHEKIFLFRNLLKNFCYQSGIISRSEIFNMIEKNDLSLYNAFKSSTDTDSKSFRLFFNELVNITRGQAIKADKKGTAVYELNPGDIDDFGVVEYPKKRFLKADLSKIEKYKIRKGDILIGVKGLVGRVTYVNKDVKNWYAGQAVAIIRFNISPEEYRNISDKQFMAYIYYFLRSRNENNIFRSILTEKSKSLNMEALRNIEIMGIDYELAQYEKRLENYFFTYDKLMNERMRMESSAVDDNLFKLLEILKQVRGLKKDKNQNVADN